MAYVTANTLDELKERIDELVTTNNNGDISGEDMRNILNNLSDLTKEGDGEGSDYVTIFETGLTPWV